MEKLKNKNLSSLVRFAVENNRNVNCERKHPFLPEALRRLAMGSSASLFFRSPPPDPRCSRRRALLPEVAYRAINTPGHSPSQAALLMELVAVKVSSSTGITLAPSPCQPRFFSFFFFFFNPGKHTRCFQPTQGMLRIQRDCSVTQWE